MRTRLVVATLVALLLVAPLAIGGGSPGGSGAASGWHEALHIDSARADPQKTFEAFDAASLNVFDIDGDGQLEIVSFNDNNRAYVLDSHDGDVLAEIRTEHPGGSSWGARDINPITITDLRGDGTPCLVVPNSASYLSAWCYDGHKLFGGGFDFDREWEIFVDAADHEADFAKTHPWIGEDAMPGMDGNAFASDVDGDGKPEIFVETDGYPGQLSFTSDGAYRWSTSYWDGNAGAVVHDLDGDGRKEAIYAADAGVIACYDAKEGNLKWTFEARKHGASPGSITVAPLVADLDGDGRAEMVFATRNVADPSAADWMQRSHAVWYALRADGSLLWRVSEAWMNPLSYTHPAAVDVDGDGDLEVIGMDWNTVGHNPGNWETTGRAANLFALDGATGRTLWRAEVPTYWSNKDFVVLDLPGGDAAEVVVNAHKDGLDGLSVRSLRDGRELGFYPIPHWEVMRGPVAADVDGDGKVELIVPVARKVDGENYRTLDVGLREGAIKIIATGAPADGVLWDANILHTDQPPQSMQSLLARVLPVPAPPVALLALAVGAAALLAGRRANR